MKLKFSILLALIVAASLVATAAPVGDVKKADASKGKDENPPKAPATAY